MRGANRENGTTKLSKESGITLLRKLWYTVGMATKGLPGGRIKLTSRRGHFTEKKKP